MVGHEPLFRARLPQNSSDESIALQFLLAGKQAHVTGVTSGEYLMKKFFFASKKCALAWLLASLIGNTSGAHAENIQFPTDAGAINIVNYGIDVSDNENDDTDAIQRAISDHIDQNKIIFFRMVHTIFQKH
jgi:hypothetical protein